MDSSALTQISGLVMNPIRIGKESYTKTLFKLVVISGAIYFIEWLTLFCATGLPGNKFYAGMAFGLAQCCGCLIGGYVLRFYKD